MSTISNGINMPVGPHRNILTEKIAIDLRNDAIQHRPAPGRVSVVNYHGKTIFDTFVCYPESINIINTDKEFSGIGRNDIDPQNGAQPFSEVRATLVELLCNRIVIGHDIGKDMRAMSMNLESYLLQLQSVALWVAPIIFNMTFRDTQKYSGYRQYANRGAHQGPSLKNLSLNMLGHQIKQGRVSSVEDAVATMEIYRKAEVDIDREQGRR